MSLARAATAAAASARSTAASAPAAAARQLSVAQGSRTALHAAATAHVATINTIIGGADRRCSSSIAAAPSGRRSARPNLLASASSSSSLALGASAAAVAVSRRSLSTALPQVGAPLRRKVTTIDLVAMKQRKQKISMVTAYTYPSAVHVDAADIDVLLVGDSVGMVELGYDTTLPVTVDDMIYHCKAVSRGAERALLVADLPFGSYEASPQAAYATAIRFLKECGMDCVKLEGGAQMAEHVRALVRGGVAVMGHIGLTPQRISVLGGFRAQGKTLEAAELLLADALALQEAGCFSLVIECVPAEVAELITRTLRIPTIGIGAGRHTDGQVLVYHDLLGMFQHAHHAKVSPSFCKRYASIGAAIQSALNEYKQDVSANSFPGDEFSPYKLLNSEEKTKFKFFAEDRYRRMEEEAAAKGSSGGSQKTKEQAAASEETIKVY